MASATLFKRILVLVALATLADRAYGRRYGKCEFATLLERGYGLSRNEIQYWVCIAEFESNFDTEAQNPYNTDGSTDYGIFQINNRYWCADPKFPGSNICRIACSKFLNNDVANSLRCAQTVYNRHGYNAWVAYNEKCANKELGQYMAECWGGEL